MPADLRAKAGVAKWKQSLRTTARADPKSITLSGVFEKWKECKAPSAPEQYAYENARDAEKAELDRERIRLWYVAATRARELLVLPRLDPKGAATFRTQAQ